MQSAATPTHRTIIIGAGPGGSSAAIYLSRFNHEALIFDAPEKVPGRTRYALEIENVLGFNGSTPGPSYLKQVHKQLESFGIERHEELVTHVTREADGTFFVTTDKPARYKAGYVIVAVGVADLLPDVPRIEEFFGHSVYPCPTCNWYQTKDRRTAIIANDDKGINTALMFNAMQPGSALYVIPDRPRPYFSEEMRKKAAQASVEIVECPLVELNSEKGMLESVTLATGEKLELEILYTVLGVKRQDLFLDTESMQVERNEEGYLEVDFKTMETSVENLFAVGPCNCGPDQVMVAAGQGVVAAMEVHERVLAGMGI
jgi:thioredoxin reductase (NADPH)